MLGDLSGTAKIYIVCGYTDLRKSIDGLMSIIRDQYEMDPYSNALFLFCGRRCDRIKALHHEKDGFVLLYKRLDNASLRATLDKLQKMLFAPHSEKKRTKDFPGQMSLFNEAESEADPSDKEPHVSTLVEGYARKKTGSRWAFRSQGQQWPTGLSRPARIISSLYLKQCTDISLNASCQTHFLTREFDGMPYFAGKRVKERLARLTYLPANLMVCSISRVNELRSVLPDSLSYPRI